MFRRKRWVELKLLRAGHRKKGSTPSERRSRKHALGRLGRDGRRGMWRGLPAVDFGTRLWRQNSSVITKHGYICTTIHCRQCRKKWCWLREGRVNHWWLELLQLLAYQWKGLVIMSCCGDRRTKWELRLTKFQEFCKNRWLRGWSYI